ncbi:MAG: DNA polymerase IV [Actinobacteria bacterium]|nr:DNA polymerase IV [Actinomycetota bacterium]
MASPRPAAILHADLDAFYASVEQLLDPSLRGRPIAVGGSVVLAASYEARAYGVHGGMAGVRARRLCPQLQFVGGQFRQYQDLGHRVMGVLRDFTPLVERISIDEAFLDVAGSIHLFGSPGEIAGTIRRRVRDEIGLPLSVGVATTKHLAKVASQVAKPDGVVIVEADSERAFLEPLPVGLLWGVGPVTRERLAGRGINTVGDLMAISPSLLEALLGRAVGRKLVALAANADPRQVESRRSARSVGAQGALGRRAVSAELLWSSLGYLADRVATRLRAAGRAGRTITVRVRFPPMRSITRSATLTTATSATLTITEVAVALAQAALADHPDEKEITLVAVSVSNLAPEAALQLALPLEVGDDGGGLGVPSPERWALDRAVDRVRERFGRQAVGFAGVSLSDVARVPEAFRELAEG